MTFSSKTEPITTKPKVSDVAPAGAASTGSIPCDSGSLREQAARRARNNIEEGDHVTRSDVPTATEQSALTLESLDELKRRDPLAAALASVVA